MQKITADLSEIPCPFGTRDHAQRVETGTLQINEDWPGIFIRGDNALYGAMLCKQAAAEFEKHLDKSNFNSILILAFLKSHAELLGGCRA